MKFPNVLSNNLKNTSLAFALLSALIIFAGSAAGQEKDTDPVLQGSTKYTMPQSATDALIDGAVVIAIHVDEKGIAKSAGVISGPMWPCGTNPSKEIEGLYKSLAELGKTLVFSPAIKDGKPTEADLGLTLNLKNPKLNSAPEIDPVTGKPKIKSISDGVINGKAVILERPAYPAEAKGSRASGSVNVQVLIDESGRIARAGAVSGHPLLQFSARDAACKSKFSPTTLAGNPVKVSGIITYNFVP